MTDANISIIVAIGENHELGRDNALIWHISDDLKRFKALTMGHPLIMGRLTCQSLPNGPLPGRRNIVLTRNPEFHPEGFETAASLEEAVGMCKGEEVFVIGGGKVYNEALPHANRLYLTRIGASCPDADTFFPQDFGALQFAELEGEGTTKSGIPYRFERWEKR